MNWNQLGPSHEKTRPINWIYIYIYLWSNRNPIAMGLNIQANGNLSTGGLHSINPINYRPWNPRFKHIKTRNATAKPSLKSPINRMEKRPEKAVKAGLAQRTSAPGCLEGLGFDGLRSLEQRARKPGKTMSFLWKNWQGLMICYWDMGFKGFLFIDLGF